MLIMSVSSYFSEVYHAVLHLMYLRLYIESILKWPTSDYHTLLVIPNENQETNIVKAMLKKENDVEGN